MVKISRGDMRKVMNILESCAMSYRDGITAEVIYNVTGRPSKQDVEELFAALSSMNFEKSLAAFMQKKKDKSLCLEDLIGELHEQLMLTELEDHKKMFIVARMA